MDVLQKRATTTKKTLLPREQMSQSDYSITFVPTCAHMLLFSHEARHVQLPRTGRTRVLIQVLARRMGSRFLPDQATQQAVYDILGSVHTHNIVLQLPIPDRHRQRIQHSNFPMIHVGTIRFQTIGVLRLLSQLLYDVLSSRFPFGTILNSVVQTFITRYSKHTTFL